MRERGGFPRLLMQPQEELDLLASELVKCFRTSDRVKVMEGRYQGETGLVVRVDADAITIVSDVSRKVRGRFLRILWRACTELQLLIC